MVNNVKIDDYGKEFIKYFDEELESYGFHILRTWDDIEKEHWEDLLFATWNDAYEYEFEIAIFCDTIPDDVTEDDREVLTKFLKHCMSDFIKLNQPVGYLDENRIKGKNSIKMRVEIVDEDSKSYLSLDNQYDFKVSFRANFMISWG